MPSLSCLSFLQSQLRYQWLQQWLIWIEHLTTHSWGHHFFYLAFKQSPGKRSHLPFDSCKFLMTNRIHLLWYVATSIDLGGNFLFQGFIHQPMWIRRTLNGEFIMMRNLWVAVIKFALAFTESFITHPLLLKQLIQGLTLLPLASCSPTVIWFISM